MMHSILCDPEFELCEPEYAVGTLQGAPKSRGGRYYYFEHLNWPPPTMDITHDKAIV